jgi:hypothetical protein
MRDGFSVIEQARSGCIRARLHLPDHATFSPAPRPLASTTLATASRTSALATATIAPITLAVLNLAPTHARPSPPLLRPLPTLTPTRLVRVRVNARPPTQV